MIFFSPWNQRRSAENIQYPKLIYRWLIGNWRSNLYNNPPCWSTRLSLSVDLMGRKNNKKIFFWSDLPMKLCHSHSNGPRKTKEEYDTFLPPVRWISLGSETARCCTMWRFCRCWSADRQQQQKNKGSVCESVFFYSSLKKGGIVESLDSLKDQSELTIKVFKPCNLGSHYGFGLLPLRMWNARPIFAEVFYLFF